MLSPSTEPQAFRCVKGDVFTYIGPVEGRLKSLTLLEWYCAIAHSGAVLEAELSAWMVLARCGGWWVILIECGSVCLCGCREQGRGGTALLCGLCIIASFNSPVEG